MFQRERGERERGMRERGERKREKGLGTSFFAFRFFSFLLAFIFSFPQLSEEFRLMATLLAYLLGTFIDFLFPVLLKNF